MLLNSVFVSYFQEFLGPEIVSHFVMHGRTVAETIKHMLMILKKNMKNAELSSLYLEAIKRVSEPILLWGPNWLALVRSSACAVCLMMTCTRMPTHGITLKYMCNMCLHEYALCITRLAQRSWRSHQKLISCIS